MDAFKEKTVGCLLVAGAVVTVLSLFLTWLFSVGGVFRGVATRDPVTDKISDVGTMNLAPVALTFSGIGILMMLGAVGYGLWFNSAALRGPRKVAPNARILSRYGYNRQGYMLNADWEFEAAEDPRYYVRMQIGPSQVSEYQCTEQVFFQCGEGMYGEAELQGNWLGRFTPYIGPPQSS